MTEDFEHISVAEWLKDHPEMPIIAAGDASMTQLAQTLLAENSRDIYIADDDNKIIGHLSFGRIVSHLFAQHRPIQSHRQLFAQITDATAQELMDPHFAYARADETLCDVIHRQLERDIDNLVVLGQDHHLLGAIKLRELVTESLKSS